MKSKNTKRSWVVVAFIAMIFFPSAIQIADDARAQGPTKAPQPRTAAQVFKNIQIIKEMPASQLQPTMQFIAASLGVDCSHCHTPPAMEKDDKPPKLTARRMLVMMNEINKNFDGRTVVTCATCHRGRIKPSGVPPLPPLTSPFASTTGPVNEAPLPTVDQILERYLKAIGGERALNKIKTRKRAGAVEVAGVRGTFELYEAAPNKFLLIGSLPPPMGSVHQSFDGTTGWVKNQNGVFEMRGDAAAQAKLDANFYAETRLKEQYKSMTVTGRERDHNREFYVIEAARPNGQVEKLFFDVVSGFLVRRHWETRTSFGPLPNAIDFDNYKKVGGVWAPFLIRRIRGGTTFTQSISEYKLNVRIDDSIFKKPAPLK